MAITLLDLIAIAFGASNALRLVSYLPQIVAVARDRHGAATISVSCWSIWIGANVSTALYAWAHLDDLSLVAVSVLNAAGCGTVLALALAKRFGAKRPLGILALFEGCIRRNSAFVKYRASDRLR
ncbi:hypothetical protein [Reyranella sp.]|uniref:hypothetical protein n=1 Tax=Reyranella sp. TaxID=1929291 RepID=UPI003D104870